MQLSFHSILSSDQEVDFFTDIILETGLPGDLDHSTLASLETVPEEVLTEEEEAAIEEQCEIEMAYDEENLRFEYYVVILDDTNDTAEEEYGTWEECKSFVATYQRLMFGHSFTARFFKNGDDNEYASVQFIPTSSDPTGYLTLTMPRRY
jgi:hypothetical protein